MISVLPVTESDLPDVSRFLAHGFLAPGASDIWLGALRQQWIAQPPNYGYMLRDGGMIVGAIGAIYSDQVIRGKRERFCNINNWYVEPAYRKHSILLLSKLLSQKGFHFTNLTPRSDLTGIFIALKFRYIDDGRITYLLNVPRLPRFQKSVILDDPAAIAVALPPPDAKMFSDHMGCRGLRQIAIGSRVDGFCHVAFNRRKIRHIPCVEILYVSDSSLFSRHLWTLRNHIMTRYRTPIARVQSRLLKTKPLLSIELQRKPTNMFLSSTLAPSDVSVLYSEFVTLQANRAS